MPTNPGVSEVYDKNGVVADIEAKRFDGTRTVQIQGDVTALQTWNGDSNTELTLNASIGAKKVTQDKIADKAVGSGQMADGSVGLTQMDPNAMTSSATSGDTRLITAGGVRTEIDNAILNRGKDYGPMTPTQINAISETIPTGSTVHVTAAGTITDGDIEVRQGEDLKYYRSGDTHYWYSMDGDFKLKQQAKTSPTASGNALSFIDSITQDENGEITATKKAVQDGTTSQKGVVQLEDSHSSTSTTKAATPNSVKSAYDLANTANTGLENKQDKPSSATEDNIATFNGTKSTKDSGKSFLQSTSTWDGTSDAKVPTAKAVQAALSSYELLSNKVASVRNTATATDTAYPSELAVRNAINSVRMSGNSSGHTGGTIFLSVDCSSEAFYNAEIEISVVESSGGRGFTVVSDPRYVDNQLTGLIKVVSGSPEGPIPIRCLNWTDGNGKKFFGYAATVTGAFRYSFSSLGSLASRVTISDIALSSVTELSRLPVRNCISAVDSSPVGGSSIPVYVDANGHVQACTDTFVNDIAYVANQSGGGGNLNKTINGTSTSVLAFMNDSEAVAIWNDAKTAAANAS